jgi:hypothetical protein
MGTEIGFLIAIPLMTCILSGIYIDNILNMSPIATVLAAFIGMWLVYINIKYLILPILEGKKK